MINLIQIDSVLAPVNLEAVRAVLSDISADKGMPRVTLAQGSETGNTARVIAIIGENANAVAGLLFRRE